jgi:hypothetical protein
MSKDVSHSNDSKKNSMRIIVLFLFWIIIRFFFFKKGKKKIFRNFFSFDRHSAVNQKSRTKKKKCDNLKKRLLNFFLMRK